MKKILLVLLIAVSAIAHSQIRIPGTNVTFNFPDKNWSYLKTMEVDDNTNIYVYINTGQTVIDQNNDTVIPFLRILVKKNCTESTFELAYSRFILQPFQSMNEYYDGIPGENGLGYVGAYHSNTDQKNYQFRMIYFKDRNICLEMRLETTSDTYAQFDKTFTDILNTVTIEK